MVQAHPVFYITLWDLGSKKNQFEHEVHAGYCTISNNILYPWPRSLVSCASLYEPRQLNLIACKYDKNLRLFTVFDTEKQALRRIFVCTKTMGNALEINTVGGTKERGLG